MTFSKQRSDFFGFSDYITAFPLIHESGDYALQVRKEMFSSRYDCLAVALPPSFRGPVIEGIQSLPEVSVVIQREQENPDAVNYVPIDPCQGVIMGIRIALQERSGSRSAATHTALQYNITGV